MGKTVVGLFKGKKSAKKGIDSLIEYGFRNDEISVLAKKGIDSYPYVKGRSEILKKEIFLLSKNFVLIAVPTPVSQEKEINEILIGNGAIKTRSLMTTDDSQDIVHTKLYSSFAPRAKGYKGGRVSDKYDDES